MFVVTLCVFYLIFYLWQQYRIAYKDAPRSVPFFKCVKIFFADLDLWNKVIQIVKLVEEGGGVARGYIYFRGIRGLYVLSDPEDSMTALKACAEKDYVYQMWEPWLGVAAFIGNVQTNKLHRKLFTKSLMPSNMDAFIKYFNIHAERFVQKLSTRLDKGPLDMVRDLRMYNLEILCDTMMAFNDLDSVNLDKYLEAVTHYIKGASHRFESLFLQHDFFFQWSEHKKTQDAALKVLHQTSDEIIRQRRKKLKEIRENKCEPSDHVVFLDVFLEAAEKGIITEKAMRGEVDGTIFAGHDTSAYTLLYALVLLGSYPEVQERAYEEVQRVLGDKKIVTKDDLAKMVYIEAIIKESMRIYPYIVFLPRRVEEDVKLKNCVLRPGCMVAVCTWAVHRHECWGPDAEEFRPERWLEPEKLPKPTVLLGFSEGPRVCVGKKYAMYSMKTLLAYLLRRYKFAADHTKLRFEFFGVLEPLSGHHVAVERRT